MKKQKKAVVMLLILSFVLSIFSVIPPTVAETAGLSNIAFRRAVYQSSAIDFNQTGHLITDGVIHSASYESAWISKTNGYEYVYVDLGEKSTINGVEIVWGDNYATHYNIQLSWDAINWFTVESVANSGGNGIINFKTEQLARYVRINCIDSTGSNYIIRELKVFGTNSISYSIGDLPAPLADGTQYLTGGNWKVERASEVGATGAVLSSNAYNDAAWLPAVVPGTILTSYLRAGAVPDPNFDDHQVMVSDSYFTANFWYRNSFTIPASQTGKRVFLNFDAINWKADIFFNGQNAGRIEGGYIRGKFDVTELANYGGENYLAVLIYKNDTPGAISLQDLNGPGPNGGALGADNPTVHASVGWDWVPTIRGRNIGIQNDVFVTYGGSVQLIDPWIITDLELNEQPFTSYENLALANGVTVTSTSGAASNPEFVRDNDTSTYWEGADRDGESFTMDLGSSQTFRTIMVFWENASPWNASHAESFTIQTSANGTTWAAFSTANQVGSGSSNVVSHTANVTARYIRFTSNTRTSNGYFGIVPTRVTEFAVYNATIANLVTNAKRVYAPDFSKSDILVKTEVYNCADTPASVTVKGVITPGNILFSQDVSLAAGETKQVDIAAVIDNPRLWWPNTYGDQPLYTANIEVVNGAVVSDSRSFQFGVRKYTYPVDNNVLALYCNGIRIICRGGNWGMDDGMLAATPDDYDIKVRLHAEANFTMIRNWVGMTNNKAFYDACDKYGLLVWDDFWLANPSDGPNPSDIDMFMLNGVDKVKKNRYHAALALYCGRNESSPPQPLLALLPPMVAQYDGTRFYFPNSAGAPVGSGGGYSLSNPRSYLGTTANARVIRSEHGIPNVPTLESIKRMISTEKLWPINDVYGIHDFCLTGAMGANSYLNALKVYKNFPNDVAGAKFPRVEALSKAYTLNDFVRVAQMINYENHKGLHEGLYLVGNANGMTGGSLMWMSQSSWPSFVWQTYDYYYDTNGGYFGLKTGNQPIHAVWDCRTGTNLNNIVLSNATPNDLEDVRTVAKLYDLNGILVWESEFMTPSLKSDTVPITLGKVIHPAATTPMKFLKLFVYDKNGGLISENFYWMNSDTLSATAYQAYQDLDTLARVDLSAVIAAKSKVGTDNFVTITFKNDTQVPALQAQVKAFGKKGVQILPTYFSDNYFSLMPGETKTITAEFNDKHVNGGEFSFELDGWNIVEKTIGSEAPDFIVADVTFTRNGLPDYVWNIDSGTYTVNYKIIANRDVDVALIPNFTLYKQEKMSKTSSLSAKEMSLEKGKTYIVSSDPLVIPDEGYGADMSVYSVNTFIFDNDFIPLYARQSLLPAIPTWVPLPNLKARDRVFIESFDTYADSTELAGQYGANSGGGGSNTIELVASPFSTVAGQDLGNAMKFTYTVGSYTGRSKTIESEYENMQVISFWFQGPGTFSTHNTTPGANYGRLLSGSGDSLVIQVYSRGASMEMYSHILNRMGVFNSKSTAPQFVRFPLSAIVIKDSWPERNEFDPATISNFGLFINSNGTVQSPAGSVIHIDEVRLERLAPIFDSIKRQHANVGTPVSFSAKARTMTSDGDYVDSDKIIYTLINPPSGASINEDTGVVTFASDAAGTYLITIKAAFRGEPETEVFGAGTDWPISVDKTVRTTVPVTVR